MRAPRRPHASPSAFGAVPLVRSLSSRSKDWLGPHNLLSEVLKGIGKHLQVDTLELGIVVEVNPLTG